MSGLGLLGSTSSAEFGERHWGRAPMVQRGVMAASFTPDDFLAVLEGELPYRLDSVRVSRARDAQHDNRGTLDLARSAAEARVAFMAGQSITLNHLQRFLDPRHRLMDEFRRLSRLTGCASGDVQLAAFHSAANGRAFGAHTDPNHVFVVQLVGEKVWVIGPEDDEQRIVLGPGDTLYLPYGHRHSVSAGEQKTLSLSFIVRPTSWSDVLLDAYAQRLRRSPWGDPAAALPWGWIDVDPRDIALEPAGIGPLDRDDVVSSLDTRAGDTLPRLPADAQLVMSDPGEAVGPATTVVRGWDSRLRVTPHGPHARIAAAGRASLVCPREVADLLTGVPETGCAVHELPGQWDTGERLAVVRQLIHDGYLRPLLGQEAWGNRHDHEGEIA